MRLGKSREAWVTLRVRAGFFLNLTCSHAARGKAVNTICRRYLIASHIENTVNLPLTEALEAGNNWRMERSTISSSGLPAHPCLMLGAILNPNIRSSKKGSSQGLSWGPPVLLALGDAGVLQGHLPPSNFASLLATLVFLHQS